MLKFLTPHESLFKLQVTVQNIKTKGLAKFSDVGSYCHLSHGVVELNGAGGLRVPPSQTMKKNRATAGRNIKPGHQMTPFSRHTVAPLQQSSVGHQYMS